MIKNLTLPETETDLHISTHLNDAALPAMIRSLLELAKSPEEKDMLLISLLTAAGSCMPNLYFRHGLAAKRYYPNLQCFIVGSAASGKGIANLALELVKPVHNAMPLLIPGDATYPAFFQQLSKQDGRGYIHESEGSVITDNWRAATMNYNTALRKAAEHEPISRSRCRGMSVIPCPQLSMLLTGTFSQYQTLVPSVENGYFSRLITLIVNDIHPFSSTYMQPGGQSDTLLRQNGEQLFRLFEQLTLSDPIEFRLTDAQRHRLGQHLETAYPTLLHMLGNDFHSVILRMAVNIQRIAMILSALRISPITRNPSPLFCSDEDYQTAELIGNKLLLHIAQAYQVIKGKEHTELPTVKPLDQKQILLSLLPTEFESKRLLAEAQSQGIPARTVARWNEVWVQNGVVQKLRHGYYKKMIA